MRTYIAVVILCVYILAFSVVFYDQKHLFIHADHFIISFFIYLYFSRQKYKPLNYDTHEISIPLSVFPILIAMVVVAESLLTPRYFLLIHVLYVLFIHLILIYELRKVGGRMLSFTPKDYILIYPLILINFTVFGVFFLSEIPDYLLVLTMIISTLMTILVAHVINRKTEKIKYILGIAGGIFFLMSDFMMGYFNFIEKSLLNDIVVKLTFHLGIFFLLLSILNKTSISCQEKAPREVSLEA